MGKRSPNPRLAKKDRNYSVHEVAALYKVHKNTVLAWRDAGLVPIADRRKPLLFLGSELSEFLEAKRVKRKRPLRPGQIYCVACHDAKEPAFNEAEYLPLTPTSGNLRGLCPTCARLIHRRASRANLPTIQGQLKVTFTDAPLSIRDAIDLSVNSDFEPMVAK
jgi:Helix-turn-helix domain